MFLFINIMHDLAQDLFRTDNQRIYVHINMCMLYVYTNNFKSESPSLYENIFYT